jgi:Flp pilus assembly protein TadD
MQALLGSLRIRGSSSASYTQPTGALIPGSSCFRTFQTWKPLTLCALAAILFASTALAQKGGAGGVHGGGGGSHGAIGSVAPAPSRPPIFANPVPPPVAQPMPDVPPLPKPVIFEDERCLPWNVSKARDTSVSVTSLQVPGKAKGEYQKACQANNKNKFEDAERHAHNAIDKFQNYAAAWVLLGVLLEEQHKRPEAHDACVRAASIDSKYMPAYLCQAELSTRSQEWEQVMNLASLSLGLNSAGDGYAYYYRATALFHTNNLADAKKSALQAAEIDVDHSEIPLYFLLAQIYEAEGDKANAATQLRQILKHHTDRQQEDAAKQYLAQLESRPSTQ